MNERKETTSRQARETQFAKPMVYFIFPFYLYSGVYGDTFKFLELCRKNDALRYIN